MYGAMRFLVVVTATVAAGCGPEPPPGDQPWLGRGVDTASATIGTVQYTVKLDGTLHFPASPVNLTVMTVFAGSAPPPVTLLEVVVTPEGSADQAARARFPARWVAVGSGWEVNVRNAFPDPDPAAGPRLGRNFPPGPYGLAIDLYEGDRQVGRIGPLDVYLNFMRTRD